MKWINLIRIAWRSMLKNKMRSLLTMLGIIIGVGAVIVMVAIGQGTQKQIADQISSLGVNLLTIYPGAFRQGSVSQGGGTMSRLTLDDVDKLKKDSTLLAGISPVIRVSVQAVGGSGNWSTSVNGVSPDFELIRGWPVATGEYFTENDVKSQAKVCLIGGTVLSNLFPNGDAVGQQIRLRNEPFRIVGVLSLKGQNGAGQDQDDIVIAPYTTVQYRLNRNRFIGQIICSCVSSDRMTDAQDEIRTIVRESHKIADGADDDFAVRNQADVIQTATQTTGTLTAFLAAVAGISLLVGGIGIMNIMLVSVTERTREIGIRMAIGAKHRDIMRQFLVESMMLSISGGVIGIVFGFIIMISIQFATHWTMVLSLPTVLLAFGFSALVGIFFGWYPARTAAALHPIDALRYE
jgi:putative ABC transport system permease protein